MSEQNGPVPAPLSPPPQPSPPTIQERPRSPADDSEKDTDTFEDAVDTSSTRSLTTRKSSAPTQPDLDKSDSSAENSASDSQSPVPVPEHDAADEVGAARRKSSGAVSQRLSHSTHASLDNVNLDDDTALTTSEDKSSVEKQPSKTLSLSSITHALPSMPWSPSAQESPPKASASTIVGPPPPPPPPEPAAPPAALSRKLTSPFSWLSRSSGQKEPLASSPPAVASSRRNTASSVATLTSNPEMMLSKLEEEKEGDVSGSYHGAGKNTLRDRFEKLRMKEETGVAIITAGAEDKPVSTPVLSPGAVASEEKGGLALQPPPSPMPQSPNPDLAPGTASGINAGPSAIDDTPVDWDLWQSVVYEGPAVVARTSPEELNRAIATGIPNAIRGVIWQVLAQSKNDELESVYRELATRGANKHRDRSSNSTSVSTSSNGNLSIRDTITSSASSVHSDHSTANGNSSSPAVHEKDTEAFQKAHAVAAAERKKKEKDDAAALQKLEKTIRRDLGARTSYSKFAASAGLQESLFGVCKAYALFDEGVGYAQGMNFLIMPILFNMPEEEAFCLLVRLMNQYHLRELFIQDMPGLHMHLYQFERLLEDLEPALYCHLHRRNISPHLYATQWFLTLFAYRFPLQLVLRIYDLILSEGLSAILRFGLVLMQKNRDALLAMSDMAQLTIFLKDRLFDVYIDVAPSAGSILENGFFGSSTSGIDKEVYRADQLVRDACEVKMTPEILESYKVEWEEKTKAEKEREAELEGLRITNANFAIKVRKLEERIEAVDGEQAALATELVHTKVENEELKDENESLKGQVRELRVVIEKQPDEIETAWKQERDDLMKRNEHVHGENQKLEKELAELEEELVQTKMRYAEINSQHETLNRKWADLKRQFA